MPQNRNIKKYTRFAWLLVLYDVGYTIYEIYSYYGGIGDYSTGSFLLFIARISLTIILITGILKIKSWKEKSYKIIFITGITAALSIPFHFYVTMKKDIPKFGSDYINQLLTAQTDMILYSLITSSTAVVLVLLYFYFFYKRNFEPVRSLMQKKENLADKDILKQNIKTDFYDDIIDTDKL